MKIIFRIGEGGYENIYQKLGGVRKFFENFWGYENNFRISKKFSHPLVLIKSGRPLSCITSEQRKIIIFQ